MPVCWAAILQTGDIPLEHFRIGQYMMGKGYRLCPLQMGIARQNGLGDIGVLSKEEAQQILAGLDEIMTEIEKGQVTFDPAAEDIHMNIEVLLTENFCFRFCLLRSGKGIHAQQNHTVVILDILLPLCVFSASNAPPTTTA